MVKRWHWISAILVLLLSFPLHFLNEWTGFSPLTIFIAPINESIWEHLKLLAIPMILFSIPEYFLYGRPFPNFLPVRLLAILSGMGAIIISFYTYTGIMGTNFLIADILTLVFGIAVAYLFSYHFLHSPHFTSRKAVFQAQAGFLVLILCLILFTCYPPDLALFKDWTQMKK